MNHVPVQVTVPIVVLDEEGVIRPNRLFHRPWDHLHSRCIEYPYCASKIRIDDRRLLDVGTAKADPVWVSWLTSLPAHVHALDYDRPAGGAPRGIQFVCADIRAAPYPNDFFDVVVAVSTIEHVGLANPQVAHTRRPRAEPDGDLQAVQEIARILRPGGRLIMTVPFGRRTALILGDQARTYDDHSIRKFEALMQLGELQVFAYTVGRPAERSWRRVVRRAIRRILEPAFGAYLHEVGSVTWKRIDPRKCVAVHRWHVEAVACCIWEKRGGD